MALKLRGGVYWLDAQIDGKRIRKSLKTGDPKMAEEAHTRELAEFYRTRKFKERPKKTFKEATERWLKEKAHKASLSDDQDKIDYFMPKLGSKYLADLDRNTIEDALPQDVKPSTRNRYRALMSGILRAAERDWDWLERAPSMRIEQEAKKRVMYLTREQAEALISALPEKYRMPVRFALLTGLRRANVFGLCWENVDLDRSTAIVHGDEAKAKQRILVPLNAQAKAMLEGLPGPRKGRVWGDLTRVWDNTWKASCRAAGVPAGFRFHDLRHTWASWHAMAGTPLSVLQELGGWHSPQMVQKYAHLSPEHLAIAAERVTL